MVGLCFSGSGVGANSVYINDESLVVIRVSTIASKHGRQMRKTLTKSTRFPWSVDKSPMNNILCRESSPSPGSKFRPHVLRGSSRSGFHPERKESCSSGQMPTTFRRRAPQFSLGVISRRMSCPDGSQYYEAIARDTSRLPGSWCLGMIAFRTGVTYKITSPLPPQSLFSWDYHLAVIHVVGGGDFLFSNGRIRPSLPMRHHPPRPDRSHRR